MDGKIKELSSLEDFKKVYMVFSGEPYNEKYTDEELQSIFEKYKENGYIYGAYNEENCIGLIALERGIREGQPVNFQSENIMYLADIAVLNDYRRRGIGNQLMMYGVMQSKLLGYDTMYMRTLENGSMSYGIARKIGFRQIPGVFQNVERERVNGSIETMKNIFLEIDLKSLNRDDIIRGVQSVSVNRVNSLEGEER